MRVLFGTLPAVGHFYPMVPLAWALRAAGHEVLVAVPEDFLAEVAAAGLPAASTSGALDSRGTVDRLRQDVWHRGADRPAIGAAPERGGLMEVAEATMAGNLDLVRRWRPDLVVVEPTARSTQLAAAYHGVPVALLPWGMLVPPEILAANAGGQWMRPGPLEQSIGLTEVPQPVLRIELCPPSYQYEDPRPVQRMRYVPYNGRMLRPDWVDTEGTRPRACVSFSSPPADVATVVSTLDESGFDVYVGVAERYRHLLDDVADRIRGIGYLALDQVLPGCALAVHDGSAGKTLTALVHGVPQLVLPQEAEQFAHAERVREIGLGERIRPDEFGADTLGAALSTVLGEDRTVKNVRRLAEEAAAQPSPAEVAVALAEIR